MNLQGMLYHYQAVYKQKYGSITTPEQWSALNAMLGCRSGQYGAMIVSCAGCGWEEQRPASCGHRSCSQCHHHSNVLWCDRQCQKLLPVPYFLVTFTLPRQLHELARKESKRVYKHLFDAAIETLRTFGCNDPHLQAELAATAVLHTHSRRLDFHPHVHLVVPGGVIHEGRKEWRKIKSKYLFNHFNLAKTFRGIFLKQLSRSVLVVPANPNNWVADCKSVGQGKQALQYLSRYLYRGVLGDHQLVEDNGTEVTFWYKDSETQERTTRTLKGEDLIRLLLIHVLPKGFRRARDYGFLHGNAKRKLALLHYILSVMVEKVTQREKARPICPCCKAVARYVGFIKPEALKKIQPG
jgi:hypothetical protein